MKAGAYLFLSCLCLLVQGPVQCQETAKAEGKLGQLIQDKNYRTAVEEGLLGLETDSMNPQIHYNLGVAYSNLKQFRSAAHAFETAEKFWPGNKALLLNLSDCYVELANMAAAEAIVKDILRNDSSDTYVWLQLAQICQRQSKPDEAAAIYSRLWSEDSTNIWYPRQIGQMLARQERYQEAVPFLETVVDADSSDQGSFLRLGQAYLKLKSVDKIPVLDKAIRQDSTQPLLYRYRGGLMLGAGIYAPAESDLQMALQLGDTSVFTCRHLGICQFQLSKYEDALWALDRTVKMDSLDSEAWYYLGFCYKWTEDIPKGIECLQKALEIAISPSTGSIYSGLGLFYNLQRDLKKARVYYEKAIEVNPDDAYPLSQLGLLVEQTSRNKEQAKQYYEQFLQEYTGSDRMLINYVTERLQLINEKLFMEGKIKKK